MASKADVRKWRELAQAAQREYPGWWLRLEDQARYMRGRHVGSSARAAVMAHMAASRESVPAMAEMLDRAMAVLERAAGAGAHGLSGADLEAAALLREWRGDPTD